GVRCAHRRGFWGKKSKKTRQFGEAIATPAPGAMRNRIIPRSLTRRCVLVTALGGVGSLAAPHIMRIAAAQNWRGGNPFSLGVASGAPRPDGFVLWTRLAPEPLSSNPETPGGMSGGDVTLRYEIATDPGMNKIVRHGSA